jgi:hypothetical protein
MFLAEYEMATFVLIEIAVRRPLPVQDCPEAGELS